jgi:hypothetical protein
MPRVHHNWRVFDMVLILTACLGRRHLIHQLANAVAVAASSSRLRPVVRSAAGESAVNRKNILRPPDYGVCLSGHHRLVLGVNLTTMLATDADLKSRQ